MTPRMLPKQKEVRMFKIEIKNTSKDLKYLLNKNNHQQWAVIWKYRYWACSQSARLEGTTEWRGGGVKGIPGIQIQSWPTTCWLRVAGEVILSPLSALCRPVNSGSRALELNPGSVTSTVLMWGLNELISCRALTQHWVTAIRKLLLLLSLSERCSRQTWAPRRCWVNVRGKATLSVSCQDALTRQALNGPVSFPPAFTVDGEAPPEGRRGRRCGGWGKDEHVQHPREGTDAQPPSHACCSVSGGPWGDGRGVRAAGGAGAGGTGLLRSLLMLTQWLKTSHLALRADLIISAEGLTHLTWT